MKKDKLYTANKWNQPAFMRDRNLFLFGGNTGSFFQHQGGGTYGNAGNQGNKTGASGSDGVTHKTGGDKGLAGMLGKAEEIIGGVMGGDKLAGTMMGGLVGGVGSAVGKIGGSLISGGLQSGAGSAISNVGGTIGSAVGAVNPLLGGAISAASGIVGGLTNRAIGMKTDQEKLDNVNASISSLNNFRSDAGSFDDISGPTAVATDTGAYKGGWLSSGKAKRKNRELNDRLMGARLFANRSIDNNITNLQDDQMNDALANYSAFGGPLEQLGYDDNMGAIEYGFMSDYLTQKQRQADARNRLAGLTPIPVLNSFCGGGRLFELGGDVQTHGSDWSNGLMHIDAGGRHEENPNQGVQLGIDNEGNPNLVEENETVFNDYVYSNRILCDAATKQLFRLPKKRDITFADLSKKLEKEASERPNDPISQAGLQAQMAMLAEQQERQKQEMEAERAKAAFEALSPEEQTAIMQQREAQEQAAQQEAVMAQQGAGMESQVPEEAMMQQQMMADGSEPNLGVEPQMNACGGKINRFDKGGEKNVGTWKNDKENHWDVFTKPGLRRYMDNLKQRIDMAPDDATKDAIRREAMNELNTLQQSYFRHVLPTAGAEKYEYSDDIKNHQQLFDRLYGNTGFYSTDENGNVRNLIAEAINLPTGAATDDKPNNWADGYNGRRTSIRNFGSTEYGDADYYKDLVEGFAELGLTYAPNENWKYGDNQLYGLSIPEAEPVKDAAPKVWDWNTGAWVDSASQEPIAGAQGDGHDGADGDDGKDDEPRYKAEWLRYAGLLGPAVGLGLQAAGVGRPDTSSLDAALEGSGDVRYARYRPLGNYLTYKPLDIWYEQNRLNANARATDRAIMNSGANQGSKMAGLLALGYNDQLASGNLFRQAQEYNDNLRKQVEEFNRGTDQYNSEQFGTTSRFNADAYNNARRANTQLRLQAASQKMDADAAWNSGIYGNISGLFKGLGDIGRENAQWNMVSDMWADGLAGTATERTNSARGHLKARKKSKGGRIKRGLTF